MRVLTALGGRVASVAAVGLLTASRRESGVRPPAPPRAAAAAVRARSPSCFRPSGRPSFACGSGGRAERRGRKPRIAGRVMVGLARDAGVKVACDV